MGQLYSAFFNNDQTAHVTELVEQIFSDLDIDGDSSLSIMEVFALPFFTRFSTNSWH
jgi:hypothetical protein